MRVNISIPYEVKQFFEDYSKKTGVPQSSLMALALSEYKDKIERSLSNDK